ncbi:hypothetical protein EHQ27_14135 [Leptospira wolffii]|uniref:hypothetical protein n=1 Tax=Leptospira wolffii TaxID=409998 RepID=UPI001082715A|nr:hypothetical protein [Leptospira wolffii]TGK55950.1 hypothetical protein EHQ32_16120 [Leptospira wolffii]TGK68370.1 hypothetical protein EHQ27_14135 [Leptospira wolffii]TGK71996.1 hypothetical protein EHQ35_11555 [Leptospira wolffii]TGL27573.1 hypothetical protein EHQ57_14380 [Leptospira wolffii]
MKKILFLFGLGLLAMSSLPFCSTDGLKRIPKVDGYFGMSATDGDILIMGQKEKGFVSLSGNKLGFFLMLPYAEDWTVKENPNESFFITSGTFGMNASVLESPGTDTFQQESYLNALADNIGKKFTLQDRKLLDTSENKVLYYNINVQVGALSVRSDNYWAVVQRPDKSVLKAHVSVVNFNPEKLKILDKYMTVALGHGFKALKPEQTQAIQRDIDKAR